MSFRLRLARKAATFPLERRNDHRNFRFDGITATAANFEYEFRGADGARVRQERRFRRTVTHPLKCRPSGWKSRAGAGANALIAAIDQQAKVTAATIAPLAKVVHEPTVPASPCECYNLWPAVQSVL